uniref:Si:ch211-191j22.3 n=1 Tax=Sphaeramia orbicularis TaxID=375764 RepID=A0A673AZA6_9TELE
ITDSNSMLIQSAVSVLQVALLRWLSSQSNEDLQVLTAVTGVRVAKDLLDRVSGQNQVQAYKTQCVLAVADFVRQNPGASQDQINAEVEQRVQTFAAQVRALEDRPLF